MESVSFLFRGIAKTTIVRLATQLFAFFINFYITRVVSDKDYGVCILKRTFSKY